MSGFVTHFVKHQVEEITAAQNLLEIVTSGYLLGSGKLIRGGHACICFTETPVKSTFAGLYGSSKRPTYAPFGISVPKNNLYREGGLPVIYQPDENYDLLHVTQQWRHMRYEPRKSDFLWEREWRIQTDRLDLQTVNASIAIPVEWYDWFEEQLSALKANKSSFYKPSSWVFDRR